jgi:predicted nucleic acid-binding protein
MKRGRSPKRRKVHPPPRCVLDSGGLTALVGGSQRAREWLRWVIEHDGAICVPTPVLVESTTGDGARDAEVNRILGVLERAATVLQAPDEATARRAGRLRYLARTNDGIDALVAAVAVSDGSPAVVLTSDPNDLARLLQNDRQVSVRAV